MHMITASGPFPETYETTDKLIEYATQLAADGNIFFFLNLDSGELFPLREKSPYSTVTFRNVDSLSVALHEDNREVKIACWLQALPLRIEPLDRGLNRGYVYAAAIPTEGGSTLYLSAVDLD